MKLAISGWLEEASESAAVCPRKLRGSRWLVFCREWTDCVRIRRSQKDVVGAANQLSSDQSRLGYLAGRKQSRKNK
ncbi:hypothetical protein CDL15_Pgr010174 [Punica granatum]|nr:hypothetical protein CDL15_Pgr010174 [Punica granatum]